MYGMVIEETIINSPPNERHAEVSCALYQAHVDPVKSQRVSFWSQEAVLSSISALVKVFLFIISKSAFPDELEKGLLDDLER